ncbi:tetratricopeptide repeat protein [Reticulibacter mediterranei]|uniref:Tetratricopeptide repeat protein n=1 Tax=Reticulibacter mediterranei TaxID=2778369 RepID=A0A8J3I964_9CHLR|nr:FxSxx-COOH system tetratricopeptide repeat protein [Reticulibacter mediterranei]GHO90221.1 tetratricopeptide repeat protein [Reticulibacter mediterranei]
MQEPNKSSNTSPLRAARLQHHWSQRELAERVEATVSTVKRWERQATIPGPYFRLKLTALFGKSEEELGLREAPALPAPPSAREATGEEQTLPPVPTAPLWTIPYLRNPYFTGRDDLLDLLDEHLAAANGDETLTTRRVALTQRQALTGLGGIGKTQIAVEYAYRMREQGASPHTLWINAASPEALMTSFTALADLLPEFAARKETDQQRLVEALKGWLEECPQRWLLIFDNADDISLLPPYLPRYGNGSILLTTRAQAVGSLGLAIDVEKMSFLEGTRLLLRRAQCLQPLADDEMSAVEQLVVALDHFPLALEQAGAYIEETRCTFAHYLHLYHRHRSILLARRGVQSTNYPDSVATTWLLSFQNVQRANPTAAQLLQVCAFLAPDHIPEELLRDGAAYWPTLLQEAVTDPLTFDQALEALLRFSLVKRLATEQQLSIHRLVQVVQVEMLSPEEQRQWAERVVCAVNHLFPRQFRENVSSWPQCLRYLEQAQACAQLIQQHQLQFVQAADLLDRAGTYLYIRASFPQAEALCQQALHLREELLGAQHPETASSFHHLGCIYYEHGKYEQAEVYYRRALAIREELLGEQHSDTARTLNNLGVLYRQQGKYEQAEAFYQQALAIREELLGTQHPDTAITLNNLGRHYNEQGEHEQAETYFRRALAIYEEQYGIWHPEIAETLNNLGLLSYEQGKYGQAEVYFRRALAINEEQLGTQHFKTAEVMTNLAELYRGQHHYEQAEQLFTRTLVIQEHTLTANHPNLARTLHGFARFHEEVGALQAAGALYQRTLTIREHVYGPHHPKTSETRERLQTVQHLLENEEELLLNCEEESDTSSPLQENGRARQR